MILLDFITLDRNGNLVETECHPCGQNEDRTRYEEYRNAVLTGNRISAMILDMYRNNTLADAGDVRTMKNKSNTIIDFCIDMDKLPDSIVTEIRKIVPKTACHYSGCYPASHFNMMTYRDNNGCVGSSWETCTVQSLDMSAVREIRHVYHTTNDAYQAGCKALDLMYADYVQK